MVNVISLHALTILIQFISAWTTERKIEQFNKTYQFPMHLISI